MDKRTRERLPRYASRPLTNGLCQMPSLQQPLPLDSRDCCSPCSQGVKKSKITNFDQCTHWPAGVDSRFCFWAGLALSPTTTLDYLTKILPAHSVLRAWDIQSCTCDSSVTPFLHDSLLPRRTLQEASGPGDECEEVHVCHAVLPSRNDWAKGPH